MSSARALGLAVATPLLRLLLLALLLLGTASAGVDRADATSSAQRSLAPSVMGRGRERYEHQWGRGRNKSRGGSMPRQGELTHGSFMACTGASTASSGGTGSARSLANLRVPGAYTQRFAPVM
jgi:hypothetical protein